MTCRNSRPEVFRNKGVLRSFAKFKGKHLGQSLFFNKVEGLRSATLLKKGLWHSCFPVNFVEFLRIPSFQNTSGRRLLNLAFLLSMTIHDHEQAWPWPFLSYMTEKSGQKIKYLENKKRKYASLFLKGFRLPDRELNSIFGEILPPIALY